MATSRGLVSLPTFLSVCVCAHSFLSPNQGVGRYYCSIGETKWRNIEVDILFNHQDSKQEIITSSDIQVII